ncbi:hypothetical protein DCC62_25310 [candidate division KSB1 bacterium]|nr:MAG: hypothetical protein DCC62_25310 [candidate division KSB1 bacterium]
MKEQMKMLLMRWRLDGLARSVTRKISGIGLGKLLIKFPTYDQSIAQLVSAADDPVRYAAVALAVKRGELSRLLHTLAPERDLYLFDTFAGFPESDLERQDARFRDTSIDLVKRALGDLKHVVFKPGYFPETAQGLENEKFAFVMLDLDLYKPTVAGMEFFYPRLVSGGYLFAHDYNSPESRRAVSRAVNEYMKDKPEKIVELPDKWGSALIRKI